MSRRMAIHCVTTSALRITSHTDAGSPLHRPAPQRSETAAA